MSFFSLLGVEFKKIKRSKISWILLAATVILWLPSIFNVHLNFEMQTEGISPENNFFIQGFLGMSWFMFPASMVVGTVLLSQTERMDSGILKMLALPVSTVKLCLSKFVVLLSIAAVQIFMMTGMYYISAAVCCKGDWHDLFVGRTNDRVFLDAVRLHPDADIFHRHRAGIYRAVCIGDQYKDMVCLSHVLSVFRDHVGIRKACGKP